MNEIADALRIIYYTLIIGFIATLAIAAIVLFNLWRTHRAKKGSK